LTTPPLLSKATKTVSNLSLRDPPGVYATSACRGPFDRICLRRWYFPASESGQDKVSIAHVVSLQGSFPGTEERQRTGRRVETSPRLAEFLYRPEVIRRYCGSTLFPCVEQSTPSQELAISSQSTPHLHWGPYGTLFFRVFHVEAQDLTGRFSIA
jgi:hypothetical protein